MTEGLAAILSVTLRMALCSTGLSMLFGVPLGLLLQNSRFRGKTIAVRVMRTLMGVPPVVMGLAVYLLLARNGPLGFLELLFTVPAMVMAQTAIITPIVCGIVYAGAERRAGRIRDFGVTMGANRRQMLWLLIREMGYEIYFAAVTAFGRSISEVGAVMIVGGNILNKTRTMTTAITLLRNKGDYSEAITLGIILLVLAFILQSAADFVRGRERLDENT